MATIFVSVVIPVYNEAATIQGTLKAVSAYFTASNVLYEIIVVDDGSQDRTVSTVREMLQAIPSVRLLQAPHRGKGAAVKQGMLSAQGRYTLFMDADSSTRIEEWQKLRPWLEDSYEVVIGSRKMRGADIRVHQSWLRETMGKGFTWLTNVMLGLHVSDVTCGFKGFRTSAAHTLVQLQQIQGWGFDAELLFLAKRLGYRMKEVPVVWSNDDTTHVRLMQDTWRSLKELVHIRARGLRHASGSLKDGA